MVNTKAKGKSSSCSKRCCKIERSSVRANTLTDDDTLQHLALSPSALVGPNGLNHKFVIERTCPTIIEAQLSALSTAHLQTPQTRHHLASNHGRPARGSRLPGSLTASGLHFWFCAHVLPPLLQTDTDSVTERLLVPACNVLCPPELCSLVPAW